jgi:hypothetical protein
MARTTTKMTMKVVRCVPESEDDGAPQVVGVCGLAPGTANLRAPSDVGLVFQSLEDVDQHVEHLQHPFFFFFGIFFLNVHTLHHLLLRWLFY